MSLAVPTTIRLAEEHKRGVTQLAELTNRSRSYIINQAVGDYLRRNATYLQELDEAVASIETGPTYAAEEVFAWMDTWGTKERKPFDEVVTPLYKNK